MSEALKPCPFLHLPRRGTEPPTVKGPTPNYHWSAQVVCNCGARGPAANTAEEAIVAWNAGIR